MNHNLSCEYGRIILRPLKREDIEYLRKLRNQLHIRKWFFNSKEISEEEQIKWFDNYLLNPIDYMFTVVLKRHPEKFIGSIANYNLDLKNKTIETGRLMVDSQNISEHGLGSDIVGAAVKIAFENFSVDSINAEILSNNERSIRSFMVGGGFKITETILRNENEIVCLSVTRKDYIKKDEELYKINIVNK